MNIRDGILSVVFVVWIAGIALAAKPEASKQEKSVARGDIVRSSGPVEQTPWIPLYQGNGRMGCCYGPWGLHVCSGDKRAYPVHGDTRLMHMRHFARLNYGMDYLLPLMEIRWMKEPEGGKVIQYRQEQSFWNGVITTHFATGDYAVTVETWFDPEERNRGGIRIQGQGAIPAVVVSPCREVTVRYKQTVNPRFTDWLAGDTWKADIRCGNALTILAVRSNGSMVQIPEGLQIGIKPEGMTEILFSVNEEPRATAEPSLERTKSAWHGIWERTARVDFPDETVQKMWIRSMAYILYSYNDDPYGPAPPNGFASCIWQFPFPEDLSFIHPVLAATGHIEVGQAWMEHWQKQIRGFQDYTQRRFKSRGIMTPWNTPYGEMAGYHDPDPPGPHADEIHNCGYICRMAYDTAVFLNDAEWAKNYADPFLLETSRFFLDNLHKKDDGLWHLYVYPSSGQDEFGGENQWNYLCALFSAQYAFEKTVERGLDEDGRIGAVLKDGLAFPAILAKEGMYTTCQGRGEQDLGKQKHPVQLNPLALLPLAGKLDDPTRKAYERRYDLTEDAKVPHFSGWTLGEFLLADVRMKNSTEFLKDWGQLLPAGYADEDFVQIYESSRRWDRAFYVTSHGFIANAFLDGLVQSWWGELELGGCVPWKGKVEFEGIVSPLGVTVSGRIQDGKGQAELKAWKPCSFPCQGKILRLKKGQTARMAIRVP